MFDKSGSPFKALKLTAECPVCRKKQFPADINLIEEKNDWQVVHVRCRACNGNILVAISATDQGMNLLGVLTDLQSREVGRFLKGQPVTADDVIAIHEHLVQGKLLDKILADK